MKKKIGNLYGTPVVIGDANVVTKNEILLSKRDNKICLSARDTGMKELTPSQDTFEVLSNKDLGPYYEERSDEVCYISVCDTLDKIGVDVCLSNNRFELMWPETLCLSAGVFDYNNGKIKYIGYFPMVSIGASSRQTDKTTLFQVVSKKYFNYLVETGAVDPTIQHSEMPVKYVAFKFIPKVFYS